MIVASMAKPACRELIAQAAGDILFVVYTDRGDTRHLIQRQPLAECNLDLLNERAYARHIPSASRKS